MPRLVVPMRFLPEVALGEGVELLVVGQDQVGVPADAQPAGVHASALEHVELGDQHVGVDDHPVADHRHDVVVEHARGNELQGEALAVDDDRVAGVVAPLVAHDQVRLLGQEVDETALAFVTPLGTYDDGRRHGASPSWCWSPAASRRAARRWATGGRRAGTSHATPFRDGASDGAPGWLPGGEPRVWRSAAQARDRRASGRRNRSVRGAPTPRRMPASSTSGGERDPVTGIAT